MLFRAVRKMFGYNPGLRKNMAVPHGGESPTFDKSNIWQEHANSVSHYTKI